MPSDQERLELQRERDEAWANARTAEENIQEIYEASLAQAEDGIEMASAIAFLAGLVLAELKYRRFTGDID